MNWGLRAGDFRKVLVFACSISHAIRLAEAFAESGTAADVVHSAQSADTQRAALDRFHVGRSRVLVNVTMLAEGFNAPDIDAICLARPTRSRVLLAQMVGRGARRAPGKDSFTVLQFVDAPVKFDLGAMDVRVLFKGELPQAAAPPRPSTRSRHEQPRGVPRFEEFLIPGYGPIPNAVGQTFGVELELALGNGDPERNGELLRTARTVIARLQDSAAMEVEPTLQPPKTPLPTRWQVTVDSSAGLEIVSPILEGPTGLAELHRVMSGIGDLVKGHETLKVNYRTGFHLHLATHISRCRLPFLVAMIQRLEPALFTLVAPSRLHEYDPQLASYCSAEGNGYCRPWRQWRNPFQMDPELFRHRVANRYASVNLSKLRDPLHLVEVRLHQGTCVFRKAALWIALWQQIVNGARFTTRRSGTSYAVFRGGNVSISERRCRNEDLFQALEREGIVIPEEFRQMLWARRNEAAVSWRKVMPLRVESWEAAGWFGAPPPPPALAVRNGWMSEVDLTRDLVA